MTNSTQKLAGWHNSQILARRLELACKRLQRLNGAPLQGRDAPAARASGATSEIVPPVGNTGGTLTGALNHD